MEALAHLQSPFFADSHRDLATRVHAWAQAHRAEAEHSEDRDAVDARCRNLVQELGREGLLRYCIRAADGGALEDFDVRSLALIRETLAWHDPLADFAFAMQGLGSAPISLAGSAALKTRYLPGVAAGTAIAAFALSEPQAGSDVAAMECCARPAGAGYQLDGCKTWISNGGIADFYCVFARTAPAELRTDGSTLAQGISAFVVDADAPGLRIEERIDSMAPHPLAMLRFTGCPVTVEQRLGPEGEGFKLALRTLDIFRTSVAAAALGFARRALDEALHHARTRRMFGQTLGDFQLTQGALADMATDLQSATLLTYYAAWRRDQGDNVTLEAAMAKMTATESAQRVIDRALQMFGGRGVERGHILERLYRDVRVLRIYEGATEVQKLIIGRALLKSHEKAPRP
jgi:acyl-CoA dehydrogenase